eukprot:1720210-Pyramimonas_sp.AAC.1
MRSDRSQWSAKPSARRARTPHPPRVLMDLRRCRGELASALGGTQRALPLRCPAIEAPRQDSH